MADLRPQSGFTGFSDPRFQQALQQALPLLEMLVEIARIHNPGNPDAKNPSPCTTCSTVDRCNSPCVRLEALLPGKFAGSAILNNTAGDLINDTCDFGTTDSYDNDESLNKYDRSYLKAIDKIRSDEIFALYKNCSFIFTPKEWRVVTLKVQEGKTYREIGENLGITTSTASDTFRRAKRRMEDHYRNQSSVGHNTKEST